MTDLDRPDDILAAEYALGLLDGEELLVARARAARQPEFADAVAFWETRLAPLIDEIGAAAPSPNLWKRIDAVIDETAASGEVIELRKRLRFWRFASFGAAAAAIAVFALVLMQPLPTTPGSQPSVEAPMVANIPIADTDLRLAVTYLPDRDEMLVSASGLTADGVHDHELWLVPDEGALRSLGVVKPGEEVRMAIDPAVSAAIVDGTRMLLSREPLGGAPDKASPGPVVAKGTLKKT